MSGNPFHSGLRIIENAMLTVGPFEDWSDVRSHGRAARRRKQGHKQRIRFYWSPDPKLYKLPDGSIVGHPVAVDILRREIAAKDAAS